jgi:hypothetical protein
VPIPTELSQLLQGKNITNYEIYSFVAGTFYFHSAVILRGLGKEGSQLDATKTVY